MLSYHTSIKRTVHEGDLRLPSQQTFQQARYKRRRRQQNEMRDTRAIVKQQAFIFRINEMHSSLERSVVSPIKVQSMFTPSLLCDDSAKCYYCNLALNRSLNFTPCLKVHYFAICNWRFPKNARNKASMLIIHVICVCSIQSAKIQYWLFFATLEY